MHVLFIRIHFPPSFPGWGAPRVCTLREHLHIPWGRLFWEDASLARQLSHGAVHWPLKTIGPNKTMPPPPRPAKPTKPSTIKPAGVTVSNTRRWRPPLFPHPEMHQSGSRRRLFRSASTHTRFSIFRLLLQTFRHTEHLLKVQAASPAHLSKCDSL